MAQEQFRGSRRTDQGILLTQGVWFRLSATRFQRFKDSTSGRTDFPVAA